MTKSQLTQVARMRELANAVATKDQIWFQVGTPDHEKAVIVKQTIKEETLLFKINKHGRVVPILPTGPGKTCHKH